ncbi:MAG: hypothetical protein EZS28_010648 [Streblomastix strix]|uniref:Uncharacterized protein n=1 Tax=Streblomastix strix TaxID=222440 RepID=A0A5J4WG17_9EUKA|nr:MAG: hypothetical protein EZS28_010648 [Streblomastix strix]
MITTGKEENIKMNRQHRKKHLHRYDIHFQTIFVISGEFLNDEELINEQEVLDAEAHNILVNEDRSALNNVFACGTPLIYEQNIQQNSKNCSNPFRTKVIYINKHGHQKIHKSPINPNIKVVHKTHKKLQNRSGNSSPVIDDIIKSHGSLSINKELVNE